MEIKILLILLMAGLVTAENYGCDGIIGSLASVDKCGICGGNNSTCELTKGLYTNVNLTSGYNMIIEIPKGAYNITISQMQQTRNYLALRKKDGRSILNGEWVFEQPGIYEAAGTKFLYRRNKVKHEIEEINAVGPLAEPVDLLIVSFEINRGVMYQYFFPPTERHHIHHQRKDMPLYLQNHHRTRHHHGAKLNKTGESMYHSARLGKPSIVFDPMYLDGNSEDEPHKQKGKNRKRKFVWKLSGYSVCTKNCGGGVQNSIFVCTREHNEIVVPDKRCLSVEKPFVHSKRCNPKPCLPEWVPSDWSSCSVSCGEGLEIRDVHCKQEISTTLTVTVSPGACFGSPPSKSQQCYLTPCSTSEWEVGPWTECSEDCGLGIKTRTVVCRTNKCSATLKPNNVLKCEGLCRDSKGFWVFSDWTNQCSVHCGKGTQTRNVVCYGGTCNNNTKPEKIRACVSDKQCNGEWYAGPWQKCTGFCDVGEQSRSVLCVANLPNGPEITSETSCNIKEKPIISQKCPLPACKSEWYTSDWSVCTKSCDSGVQKREVLCLDENNVSSTACVQTFQPGSYHVCNMNPCSILDQPQLTTHETGNHNEYVNTDHPTDDGKKDGDCVDKLPKHNCHMVVQARMCRYLYYHNSCCMSCKNKKY